MMTTLAIEINDNGLLGVDATGVVFDSPGFALVDGEVLTGDAAQSQARLQPSRVFNQFWQELSLEALPGAVRGAETQADLAFHHLRQVWERLDEVPDDVIVAVPGSYSREQLSLLLGIAREIGLPVRALIDTAVAAARVPQPGKQIIHLDVMRHQAVLTRLSQGGRLRRERVDVVDDAGLADLHATFAQAVADIFVRNTRYDPMHSAAAEQQFYDRLPRWLSEVASDGRVTATVEHNDKTHDVEVTADMLRDVLSKHASRLQRHLAALTRAGEDVVLLLSDRLQGLPGLEAMIAGGATQLLELQRGAAGRGALARESEVITTDSGVNYVTSVRWDTGSARQLQPPEGSPPSARDVPSHVMLGDRLWRLGEHPLQFGSDTGEQGKNVLLTGELDGVSGTHCSLQRVNGEVRLTDHSRHGTYVNDRRVQGESVVFSGDFVRLGGGSQVFLLVTEQT